jgi:hypothetical protein
MITGWEYQDQPKPEQSHLHSAKPGTETTLEQGALS